MDGDDLVLSLLKETRDSLTGLTEKLNSIETCIVGRENCEKRMDAHDKRIRKVEMACAAFEVVQEQSIDEGELLTAKNDAIQTAQIGMNDLDARLKSIEDKLKVLDLTWGTVRDNPVLLTAFLGLGSILTGVIAGRILELTEIFGPHSVSIGLGIALIALISAWITRRRTKKALQHVGLIHTLIILTLIVPCMAQEPIPDDEEIIEVIDTKPMIPDPAVMLETGQAILSIVKSGDWSGLEQQDFSWFNLEQEQVAADFHNMSINQTGMIVA